MVAKPTYSALERKIKKLEKEALEYMRKEKVFVVIHSTQVRSIRR